MSRVFTNGGTLGADCRASHILALFKSEHRASFTFRRRVRARFEVRSPESHVMLTSRENSSGRQGVLLDRWHCKSAAGCRQVSGDGASSP
jgi:hypothetical protein